MTRSTERLQAINKYLCEHYPKEGSKACSQALSEPLSYIQSRVQALHLLRDNPANRKKVAVSKSQVAILQGKVDAKNREIAELWELLRVTKAQNHTLRADNIRMIGEKVQAKAHAKNNV